jgi:hypothetical protein
MESTERLPLQEKQWTKGCPRKGTWMGLQRSAVPSMLIVYSLNTRIVEKPTLDPLWDWKILRMLPIEEENMTKGKVVIKKEKEDRIKEDRINKIKN